MGRKRNKTKYQGSKNPNSGGHTGGGKVGSGGTGGGYTGRGSATYHGSRSTHHGGGYSGGNNYSGYSGNMSPTKAFEAQGIEFWGSSKGNLDKEFWGENDLILNATGTKFTQKPFVKNCPEWLKLPGGGNSEPSQAVFEWKDYGPPPKSLDLKWWASIIKQAKKNKIERIICCCVAGKGRTGTALSALALASGFAKEPDEAIDYIRDNYCSKAVESDSQELYLWLLMYNEEDLVEEDEEEVDAGSSGNFQGSSTSSTSQAASNASVGGSDKKADQSGSDNDIDEDTGLVWLGSGYNE